MLSVLITHKKSNTRGGGNFGGDKFMPQVVVMVNRCMLILGSSNCIYELYTAFCM